MELIITITMSTSSCKVDSILLSSVFILHHCSSRAHSQEVNWLLLTFDTTLYIYIFICKSSTFYLDSDNVLLVKFSNGLQMKFVGLLYETKCIFTVNVIICLPTHIYKYILNYLKELMKNSVIQKLQSQEPLFNTDQFTRPTNQNFKKT